MGIESPRPYDLRHGLASLLFAEGMNPAEIAERNGALTRDDSPRVHARHRGAERDRKTACGNADCERTLNAACLICAPTRHSRNEVGKPQLDENPP